MAVCIPSSGRSFGPVTQPLLFSSSQTALASANAAADQQYQVDSAEIRQLRLWWKRLQSVSRRAGAVELPYQSYGHLMECIPPVHCVWPRGVT